MIDIKKQIESIISDLVNNAPISSILLKAQAIAFYLKDDSFAKWVKLEQEGYSDISDKKELPDYRKIKCAIKVELFIPFRGTYSNLDFPIDAIDDETIREYLSRIYFLDPISIIEKLGENQKDDNLQYGVPAHLYSCISKCYPNGEIEAARKITSLSYVKSIIDSVKSKLLDFFLKLEEQIDLNVDFDVMANKDTIHTILNQTIKAAVVNTGNGNISVSQSEVIGGNENVSISNLGRSEIEKIISEIEFLNTKYNNEDIACVIDEIKNELQKNQQNPHFIKRAFNAIKGIACGIAANEFTPWVDKGIEYLNSMF